jgi:alpha-beta hydrolase superfamily lysophospholipase
MSAFQESSVRLLQDQLFVRIWKTAESVEKVFLIIHGQGEQSGR